MSVKHTESSRQRRSTECYVRESVAKRAVSSENEKDSENCRTHRNQNRDDERISDKGIFKIFAYLREAFEERER